MLGLSTRGSSNSNQLNIYIPDELKGIELQIIILPASKENLEIDFFSYEDLRSLSSVNLGTQVSDNEDYTKW